MKAMQKLLAGRYRLLEQIDSGGTSNIYRARDEMTGDIVAVKILKPELTDNEEFVTRFKKEVQASLKLRHANIIRAYDGGLDDGKYYIVMELVEGKTLKHLININGPLPVKYVVSVAKKLCLALEYAHVKGFVHRDIKPHNVLIDMTGEPYIADFGIARNLAQNTITLEEDNVMGSVHYFSPEQARGERADRRSDLYSLGIMLYEMLAGRVPFDSDTSVSIALKHINEAMPDVTDEAPEVPQSIRKIIGKATQKDKHFRYKSAFAVYEDLQRCLAEPDGEYVKYTESKRAQQHTEETHRRRSRKGVNKVFVTVGIGVAVAAVVIFIVAFAFNMNMPKELPVPETVGMDEQTAVRTLEGAGLVPQVANEFSSEQVGRVIAQDPTAKNVLAGSAVKVTVSMGAATSTMPNVTDMSLEDAKRILGEAGIGVEKEVPILEGDASVGFVVEQYPLEGEPVPESGAVLSVKRSPDESKVRAPNVTGLPVEEAIALLKERGFEKFFIREIVLDAAAGSVALQKPAPEEEYARTEPVYLDVSRFHAAEYSYSGNVPVEVSEDKTRVTIAVGGIVDGQSVYYVLMENLESAGVGEIHLSASAYFDETAARTEGQLVIFVGNKMSSQAVTFEKVGEND